jgi:hypothetical protein
MILINGCSFTYGVGLIDRDDSYTNKYCISKNLTFKNISAPGLSHDNIRSTAISEILNYPNQYKLLIINWTTPWRLNIGRLLPARTPMNIMLASSFNGIQEDVEQNHINLSKFWNTFFDAFYYIRCYFESVYLVQEFCKSKNIPVIFTNTSDIIDIEDWIYLSRVIKTGTEHPDNYLKHIKQNDFLMLSYIRLYKNHDMDEITNFFKTITCYVDEIDWNNFIGLKERALYNSTDPWPVQRDAHPGIEAHTYWFNLLSQNKKLNQIVNDLYS